MLWDGRGEGRTFLFDVLPLAGLGALGDGLAEEGHEFAVADGWGVSSVSRGLGRGSGEVYLSRVNLE